MFDAAMTFFSKITLSVNLLKCISMKNQECKLRPQIMNVNSDEPVLFPFNIKTSKCCGSCSNINDSYTKLFVAGVEKNLNVSVFNLMSKTNKTRHIEWHETSKCKCRLDASVCNNKKRWNKDKLRCECNELIDKGVYNKGFIWNPSNCEYECDNSWYVGEYLDYENCKYRESLLGKQIEECAENIDAVKMVGITLFKHENMCISSCTIYVVLIAVIFTISIGIDAYFVYSHLYLKIMLLMLGLVPVLKQKLNNVSGKYQTN